jgi:hypothetical protein
MGILSYNTSYITVILTPSDWLELFRFVVFVTDVICWLFLSFHCFESPIAYSLADSLWLCTLPDRNMYDMITTCLHVNSRRTRHCNRFVISCASSPQIALSLKGCVMTYENVHSTVGIPPPLVMPRSSSEKVVSRWDFWGKSKSAANSPAASPIDGTAPIETPLVKPRDQSQKLLRR